MRLGLNLFMVLACVALLSFNARDASAGGGPENVILVVNADDPSSLLLANHYIHLRQIPPTNVVYLSGMPKTDQVALATFQLKIMRPILEKIRQEKIGDHVDYIVYSSGFPTAVKIGPHLKKMNALLVENGQSPLSGKIFKPFASLTSATFFFSQVIQDDPTYISLNANRYMSGSTQPLLRTPFQGDSQLRFEQAVKDYAAEEYDRAIVTLLKLSKENPSQVAVSYWLARCYAKKKDSVNSLQWLGVAMSSGWCYSDYTKSDPAFKSLAGSELFGGYLRRMPNLEFKFLPSRGFDSSISWGRNGFPNSSSQGRRYVLSTMLAVNQDLGISERDSLDQLTASVATDGTRPKGTFYFSKTSNVRTTTRMASFEPAIVELQAMGYQGEVVESPMPMKKNDVLGAMLGAGKLNWRSSKSKILPGAIVENLTSFGGIFRNSNKQTPATDFMKYGAAGSSGTVVEPYALQAKFPHPRIHVHYVRGCTLAEAFYQAVQSPFQLLILGDALCRPFASQPVLDVKGEFSEPLSGTVAWQIETKDSPLPVQAVQTFVDGRLLKRLADFSEVSWDTTQMSDGYHELRLIGISQSPYSAVRSVTPPAGAIQTQSTNVFEVIVDNRGHFTELSCDQTEVAVGKKVKLKVNAPGAEKISVYSNTRRLSKSDGASAEFKIDTRKLGRGPVRLQAIADFGGSQVRSRPITINVLGDINLEVPETVSQPKK